MRDLHTGCAFTVLDGCIAPKRAYRHDAGLDLALQETITIMPGETVYAGSGVKFRLQPGWFVSIMTRSSTFTHGLSIIPTVIDAGYTGQASIIVTNTTAKPITLQRGERFAQAVLQRYYLFDSATERQCCTSDVRGMKRTGSSGISTDI